MISSMTISTPVDFSFWKTVNSHGWCSLPPFTIDRQQKVLNCIVSLSRGSAARCEVTSEDSKLNVKLESSHPIDAKQRLNIRRQLQQCLRLDEDFTEFYREARRHKQYRWIPRMRVGRLLRAPTVFEDVVKMICTTNCSWALTENMVGNLTTKLGTRLGTSTYSFPTPETIAGVDESFLRKEIKSGYRSPYLLELAQLVAQGKLTLESWRNSDLTTKSLYDEVLTVKGMGAYAAGNIMRLLGRYDYLALDSWVRKKFSEIHKKGRKVSDSTIERHYAPFGKWKGLFFWLEMTEYWYKENFPF
jgi:3-methyladenine DNA glycosylase/8-oxoguanine DNA glycosylase